MMADRETARKRPPRGLRHDAERGARRGAWQDGLSSRRPTSRRARFSRQKSRRRRVSDQRRRLSRGCFLINAGWRERESLHDRIRSPREVLLFHVDFGAASGRGRHGRAW